MGKETPGSRNKRLQHQMAKMVGLLLLSSLWGPLHAQTPPAPSSSSNSTSAISPTTGDTPDSSTGSLDDFITSVTNVFTPETRVVISAPLAIHSKSLYVFTTGIPIQPVYIQAPAGLMVWLTIQCHGGAARLILPQYVANFTLIQWDSTGEWILTSLPLNSSSPVTGLGIKFIQNVSVANDALATLRYGKGAKNDIAGKATMTITLNWNATSAREKKVIVFEDSKTISIWAPTALTSLPTFQATLAGVCIVGIFGLFCIGYFNTNGVTYLRRFNVLMATETRDQEECDQNRVFNPLWMPCAPSKPGYYNIESTPNSMLLVQRRMEIQNLILRTPSTFSLMDRLTRAKYLKASSYGMFGLQLPCTPAAAPPPRPPVDWSSSDDEARKASPPMRSPRAKHSRKKRQQQPGPSSSPTTNLPPQRPSPQQIRAPSYNQGAYLNYPQAQAGLYDSQGQQMYNPQRQQMYNPQGQQMYNPQGQQMYNAQGQQMYDSGALNHENITVGFAFIHHRFAAKPEIVEVEEEEVESGTSKLEIVEVEEEVGEGSDLDFDRASESFASPLSDLYEDVLQS